MEIYCEVCECNIWKCGWTKRVKTQKHRIACGDVVVEEVYTSDAGSAIALRYWNNSLETTLLAMFALLIGKDGRIRALK